MLITSFVEAQSWLRGRPKYHDVVSVGRDRPVASLCRNQICLDFDDLNTIPDTGDGSRPNDRLPQTKHVTRTVSFARKSDDEHLLIHCQAGLSRSTALAWCVLLDRLRDPSAATEALFNFQPQAIPNAIIVHLGLETITGSSKDFKAVRAHMQVLSRHPRKLLFM